MFSPNFHQAMLEIDDEKAKPGTIIQEIQLVFMFGEKIVETFICWNIKEKR